MGVGNLRGLAEMMDVEVELGNVDAEIGIQWEWYLVGVDSAC